MEDSGAQCQTQLSRFQKDCARAYVCRGPCHTDTLIAGHQDELMSPLMVFLSAQAHPPLVKEYQTLAGWFTLPARVNVCFAAAHTCMCRLPQLQGCPGGVSGG